MDAAVSAEGAIALDDALSMDEVDEPDAEAGMDNERILLLGDLHGSGMYPEANSGHGPDHVNPTEPTDQQHRVLLFPARIAWFLNQYRHCGP